MFLTFSHYFVLGFFFKIHCASLLVSGNIAAFGGNASELVLFGELLGGSKMIQPWHRGKLETIGIPWENHGKMGKPWENP